MMSKNIYHLHFTKARKGIHPGFETQGRLHQKSKTGVSMAPRKRLVSFNFFFKLTIFIDDNMKRLN